MEKLLIGYFLALPILVGLLFLYALLQAFAAIVYAFFRSVGEIMRKLSDFF